MGLVKVKIDRPEEAGADRIANAAAARSVARPRAAEDLAALLQLDLTRLAQLEQREECDGLVDARKAGDLGLEVEAEDEEVDCEPPEGQDGRKAQAEIEDEGRR